MQRADPSTDIYEEIVRAMYRGILRREGDPEGVRAHVGFLRAAPGLANLSVALKSMSSSDEFRNRFAQGNSLIDVYEDVVHAMYRAHLGRDADAGALENALLYLRSSPGVASLVNLFRMMLESEEYRARQNSAMLDDVRRSTAMLGPKIEEQPLPFVMSLGPACYVSTMLERWELRNFAGPFDFIFSSPRIVEAALRDDFRTFLSRDEFEFLDFGHGDVRTNHRSYAPMAEYPEGYDGPMFLHHNLHDPQIYEHVARSADRLRRALATRSLMITMVRNTPGRDLEIQALSACIAERAPEIRLLAFFFGRPGGNLLPEIDLIRQRGHHRFYALRPISEMGRTGFGSQLDEIAVMRMVHQWSFDLQAL